MAGANMKVTAGHPDPTVVRKAEAIFKSMGLTAEQAVALFYKQTALRGSFPITDLLPNEETLETITKARAREDLVGYESLAEAMAEFENARSSPDCEI